MVCIRQIKLISQRQKDDIKIRDVKQTSLRRSDGRSGEEEAQGGPYHSVQLVVARGVSVSSLR